MIETAGKAILLLFLAVCAFLDIKCRKINIIILAAGGAAGTAVRILSGDLNLPGFLAGIIPGLLLVLISFAGRQSVGYADSLITVIFGIFTDVFECISMLLAAFLLCIVFCAVSVFSGKKRWKDSVAFVPFMLAGYVAVEVINRCQNIL